MFWETKIKTAIYLSSVSAAFSQKVLLVKSYVQSDYLSKAKKKKKKKIHVVRFLDTAASVQMVLHIAYTIFFSGIFFFHWQKYTNAGVFLFISELFLTKLCLGHKCMIFLCFTCKENQ